jgi:hypothetical protein
VPAAAFALVGFFAVVALLAGAAAWWIVRPRRPAALLFPVVASFAALYLVGHRLGLSIGPEVTLFGFQVAIAWDVAVAVVAAGVAALLQSWLLRGRRAPA